MSNTVTAATFMPLEGSDPALPGDPFARPRYMYGQLLGADDFTTEQRYHLLRARLRNALLHGSGVVCGLDITNATTTEPPAAELRCTPGLAIDPLGREVFVPEAICLDVTGLSNTSFWSDLHPSPKAGGDSPVRRAYAVLSYRACLSAQVPAIAPPCTDATNSLAYSRVLDSYQLCLEAVAPPDPNPLSRDWLAMTTPRDVRARLQALITKVPPNIAQLWAQPQDAKILLATVDLKPVGAASNTTTIDAVDTSVRALLPDVQTVAQIATGVRLVGPAMAATGTPDFTLVSATVAAGTGSDAGKKMVLTATLSAPVRSGTVTATSLRVFKLAVGAWAAATAEAPSVAGPVITVKLTENWTAATTWQLVLSGGGAQPIMDTSSPPRPLAGNAGDAALPSGRGRDASVIDTFTP
jgi:hypothetical protein